MRDLVSRLGVVVGFRIFVVRNLRFEISFVIVGRRSRSAIIRLEWSVHEENTREREVSLRLDIFERLLASRARDSPSGERVSVEYLLHLFESTSTSWSYDIRQYTYGSDGESTRILRERRSSGEEEDWGKLLEREYILSGNMKKTWSAIVKQKVPNTK